ncbi:MAG: FecR domain-containing protein [Lachnospiraceae bacterium]|nr:FecR domain-containing protein [Lachnospiraceae bacterium]
MNKKVLFVGGGALAVVAIVVALIFIFMGGEDAYRSIKVFEIDGSCKVERDGDSLDAFKNMALSSGDSLTVGDGSFARLKLDDDKYVYLEANTKINLTATGTANDSKTMVYIERGSMLTEVKKKLSATSSYDIVTPNTTMSIRGTKTLTQVLEDTVTGHVQTSNAVLEGQVKIKAVKVKADGTVVSVEKDLGAGEGNAFSSNKEELVSQEEMKSIADTGASVSGIKVEIVSEKDADVVFDVATFEASFLENVKNILVADAQAETGEEGLSQEQIDSINDTLNLVMESFDTIQEVSQQAIYDTANNSLIEQPVYSDNGNQSDNDPSNAGDLAGADGSDADTDAADTTTEDEGTETVTGEESLINADDLNTGDEDDADGADNDGNEADPDGADADQNAYTDDDNPDEADEDGEEDKTDEAGEDDSDEDEATDEEESDDEDKSDDELDSEDEEDKDKEDEDKGNDDGEPTPTPGPEPSRGPSSETETETESGTETETETQTETQTETEPAGDTGGTGSNTGTSTPEPTQAVTFETTRSFGSSQQSGSSVQEGATTVGLVFYSGGSVVSAGNIPNAFAVNAKLPGEDGSNYSVTVDEQHVDAYEFTGWYITESLARESDPNNRVITMPSSSEETVTLWAGIRKKPVRIVITNLNTVTGKFVIPNSTEETSGSQYTHRGTDASGHEYYLSGEAENILTINGYEYGDSFALPESSIVLEGKSADLTSIPYITGLISDNQADYFVGYSTSGEVKVADLMTSSNPEEAYEGEKVFLNHSTEYFENTGAEAGINREVTLNNELIRDGVFNLYAYFATEVKIETNDQVVKTSSGNKNISQLFGSDDTEVKTSLLGSATDAEPRTWKITKRAENDFTMTTWYQGNVSVVLPELMLCSGYSADKYAVRLSSVSERGSSFINNGKEIINTGSFSFNPNSSALPMNFVAKTVRYAVIDLSGTTILNRTEVRNPYLTNPYYIREEGDNTESDLKFKIALVGMKWKSDDPIPDGFMSVPTIDEGLSYNKNGAAFGPKQQGGVAGNKTRVYVMVPDDAYYPWGERGRSRVSDPDNMDLTAVVGQDKLSLNAFVGYTDRKLLGFEVNYNYESELRKYNALYAFIDNGDTARGQYCDYSTPVTNGQNTVMYGALLSLGLEDECPFLPDSSGQVVLKPIFGPVEKPFSLDIVYNDLVPYLRIGDIDPDFRGYVSEITNIKDADCCMTEGSAFEDKNIRDLYWNSELGKYMPSEINDSGFAGEMVYDEVTHKYHQDIPLQYALSGLPSGTGSLFARGFGAYAIKNLKFKLSCQDSEDTMDCGDITGSYSPCVYDIKIDNSKRYRYTGFMAPGFGEGGTGKLTRVVDQNEDDFEPWRVIEDLRYKSGTHYSRWGGALSPYKNNDKMYGWKGQGQIESMDFSLMIIRYDTEGNIRNVLHSDSWSEGKQFGGLLQLNGDSNKDYKRVQITNKDTAYCYSLENVSAANLTTALLGLEVDYKLRALALSAQGESESTMFISGINSGELRDVDYFYLPGPLNGAGTLYTGEDYPPDGWMCIKASEEAEKSYWIKIGTGEHDAQIAQEDGFLPAEQ